jgi:hypothetical protein
MAARSHYNERLLFEDPGGSNSASRSTRYRNNKRAREQQEYEQCELQLLHAEPSESLPTGSLALPPADSLDSLPLAELDSSHYTSQYESENPQLLEAEVGYGTEGEEEDDDEEDDEVMGDPETLSLDILYDGAPLTMTASNIMIMHYKMRHKLTDQALADLLRLLQLHCPTPNQCVPSIYHFKKKFREANFTIRFHYFCSKCFQSCTNQMCTSNFDCIGSLSSFMEVPIEPRLQTLFKCK